MSVADKITQQVLRVEIDHVKALGRRDDGEEPQAPGEVRIFIDFEKLVIEDADEGGSCFGAVEVFAVIPAAKRACFSAHLLLELDD